MVNDVQKVVLSSFSPKEAILVIKEQTVEFYVVYIVSLTGRGVGMRPN